MRCALGFIVERVSDGSFLNDPDSSAATGVLRLPRGGKVRRIGTVQWTTHPGTNINRNAIHQDAGGWQ